MHLSLGPAEMSSGGRRISFSNTAASGWLDILHVALGTKAKAAWLLNHIKIISA